MPTGSDITAFLKRERAPAPTDDRRRPSTTAAVAATDAAAGVGQPPRRAATAVRRAGSDVGHDDGDVRHGLVDTGRRRRHVGLVGDARRPRRTRPRRRRRPHRRVPAGWYADPAGRYELRYWDGSAWTEHVSRAGQQYTDPPVA